MESTAPYPRYLANRLEEALADTPVVLLHGPRQSGKTTLARQVGERLNYAYITFDDDGQRASAESDPVGFVADLPERVILDEVQRVPGLFTSIKADIDKNRYPGKYLMTGSADVLVLPTLADSLAGRLATLRLHPLSQVEIHRNKPTFFQCLWGNKGFSGGGRRLGSDLHEYIVRGGYPPALTRSQPHRISAWYRDYVETLVQRDVQDISRVQSLEILPKLLAVAAGQSARLLNVLDLSSPFKVSRPTIRDYITLLSRVFLLDELGAWHRNHLKRLVKAPKLHIGDSGLACALMEIRSGDFAEDRKLLGQLLETFIYQELRRQASWEEETITFSHYRDRDLHEVDIVVERGVRQLCGIEVKASSTVRNSDFKGLLKLRDLAGERFFRGILLYDGNTVLPFGEGLSAVPISRLWDSTEQEISHSGFSGRQL